MSSSSESKELFELADQVEWNSYKSHVLSEAGKAGIAKYFDEAYVFRDAPVIDPNAVMPVAFPATAPQWEALRRDIWKSQYVEWNKESL